MLKESGFCQRSTCVQLRWFQPSPSQPLATNFNQLGSGVNGRTAQPEEASLPHTACSS